MALGFAAATTLIVGGVIVAPAINGCTPTDQPFVSCVISKITGRGGAQPSANLATDDEVTATQIEEATERLEQDAAAQSEADGSATNEPAQDIKLPDFTIARAEADGSVVIVGTADPEQTVVVRADGETLGETKPVQNGEWVFVPDQPLAPGGVEITVEAIDQDGGIVQSAKSEIVLINPSKDVEPIVIASVPGQASNIIQGLKEQPTALTATTEDKDLEVVSNDATNSGEQEVRLAPEASESAANEVTDDAADEVAEAEESNSPEAPADLEVAAVEQDNVEPESAEPATEDQPATEAAAEAESESEAPAAPSEDMAVSDSNDSTESEPTPQGEEAAELEPAATEQPAAVEDETLVESTENAPAAQTETPITETAPTETDTPETSSEETKVAAVEEEASAPTPVIASALSVLPTIDAIEIDGVKNFIAGGGPEDGIVRLYVENEFVADAKVSDGRWLVETENVLVDTSQRVRADLINPETAEVLARAEVNFVVAPIVTAEGEEETALENEAEEQSAAEEAPIETAMNAAAASKTDRTSSTEVETQTAPEAADAQSSSAPEVEVEVDETMSEVPISDVAEDASSPAEPTAPKPSPQADESAAAPSEMAEDAAAPADETSTDEAPAEDASTEDAVAEHASETPAPASTANAPATPAADEMSEEATEQSAAEDQTQPMETESEVPTITAIAVDDAEGRFVSGKAIIRQGDNLWTIARRVYGAGIRYTTIFEANANDIRNPNLIFPGQVFELPQE